MSEVRLIDANALEKALDEWAALLGRPHLYSREDALFVIQHAHTITPESLGYRKEVVGRWKRVEDTEADWRCSACKSEVCLADNAVTPKGAELYFCPNCGARMDKEDT